MTLLLDYTHCNVRKQEHMRTNGLARN